MICTYDRRNHTLDAFMTPALRLALIVSFGIHLLAAYLAEWLRPWIDVTTTYESSPASASPPRPFSARLKMPPVLPASGLEPVPSDDQPAPNLAARFDDIGADASRSSNGGGNSLDRVAPRFITPPNLTFIEFYPQRLNVQVTFRIFVSSAGLPEKIEPIGSFALPSDLLSQIIKYLYSTRFHPAMEGGYSVRSYLDIVIGVEPDADPQLDREPGL